MKDLGFEIPVGPSFTGRDEKDFSIIIAHRGPGMGLWMTIHSCEIDLQGSNYKYEYIIVNNGQKMHNEVETTCHYLGLAGKMGDIINHEGALSPPTARQLGTESAKGKILFFFDNHCMVERGYFSRALESMEKYGMDMLHSATKFYEGEKTHYEYELLLRKHFWGQSKFQPFTNDGNPYRIAVSGHGGFAVRADVWREVGGYGPVGLFEGYGGEEVYFDLKMWQLGKNNWLDPKVVHWHFAGQRGYPRHYTDDFFRNMMMTANIIGGGHWMNKVFDSFLKYPRYQKPGSTGNATMFDLMTEAHERSEPHAKALAKQRQYSLDELLMLFRTQNISH